MRIDSRSVERSFAAILIWIAAIVFGLLPARASAAEAGGAIEAGREGFEHGRFPWYDAERDALKPLTLPPSAAAREPVRFDGGFLRYAAWGMLAVALVALVAFIAYAVRNRTRRPGDPQKIATPAQRAAVEALPFLADRSRADLLGDARRHYQLGNYSEAIIYLFSYQLVELDRFARIRLAKGKTNRQYLREASQVPPLRLPLELTMTAFEDVFFGRRELDRGRFEACWNQLPAFEHLVSQTGT